MVRRWVFRVLAWIAAILLGETMIDYATRMWINPPALLQ